MVDGEEGEEESERDAPARPGAGRASYGGGKSWF